MRMTWSRIKGWAVMPELAGYLLTALGLVLRLRQYIANRSLWADEAALAMNLVNRTFQGLTQTLDYNQGAPIGFLFIEKFAMTILGNRDYILRLFPLLSGIAACLLFYMIAKSFLKNNVAILFALLVFAISWPLIYYSSELKQYSSDAMFGLLLIYLSLRCFSGKASLRDFILFGIVSIIALWTAYPSAFVLAAIGVALALEEFLSKDYRRLAWAVGLGLTWTIALGTVYLVSVRHLLQSDYLMSYWQHSFLPVPPWSDPDWFSKSYLSLLTTISPSLDRWYLALICSLVIVVGIFSWLLRDRISALLVLLPFVMASIASAMQRYPLRGRFTLFLVPFAILLMAEGLGRIYSLFNKWNRIPAVAVSAALALALLWVPLSGINGKFRVPPMGQDIKPVMDYVSKNRAQGDIVYVYHSARNAFVYYAPFYGLDQGDVIVGQDLSDAPALEGFYSDIDQLKGKGRVWFIVSNITDCGGCKGDKETYYVQYIGQFGSVVNEFHAPSASVYLYNLTAK